MGDNPKGVDMAEWPGDLRVQMLSGDTYEEVRG